MIAKNQKDSITLFIRFGFNREETPIYTNGLRFSPRVFFSLQVPVADSGGRGVRVGVADARHAALGFGASFCRKC
ncbi:hypothetical protein ES319_A08G215000v1 [Gossypium barbadense]|uniref:Uncharacterized protein n=1 Tax=Gossypium barbadense TaxID=3634 RepID=A0A5J5UV04_GOSBA|nr:hypothetical protein ES319_A08G215000v1 [Gossypium barbadense]